MRSRRQATRRKAAIPTTSKETISTANKGRHAELIAITALLANGWQVMEPTTPDVFDLGITRPSWTNDFRRVQVKTARHRIKDGAEWIVVTGTRNNGQAYSTNEVDVFIGVYDGIAYMFENTGLTEYWCKPTELDERWTRLDASITNIKKGAMVV